MSTDGSYIKWNGDWGEIGKWLREVGYEVPFLKKPNVIKKGVTLEVLCFDNEVRIANPGDLLVVSHFDLDGTHNPEGPGRGFHIITKEEVEVESGTNPTSGV